MSRTARVTAVVGSLVLVTATLAACSSSSSDASSEASASMVGGMTECTEEKVAPAAQEAAAALGAGNVFTLESLECSDGWAVATGILGSGETASDAPQGAPTSFIFQAEGQFWVPQDKAAVCGSDPAATAAPADATIPADLYTAGCAAG